MDAWHRRTKSEFERPYELHRSLSKAFPNYAEDRLLFRPELDEKRRAIVFVQSKTLPDWERVKQEWPHLRSFSFKEITLSGVSEGQQLRFCILCRPTKQISSGDPNVRGTRTVLRDSDDLFTWLSRKGEIHGFEVVEATFSRVYWRDSRGKDGPLENESGSSSGHPLLGAVRFEGRLVVLDADRIRDAVASGIGVQKAFGFGLLSLAPG